MTKLIGKEKASSEALRQMQERGGEWYAYQNHALDSNSCGHLQFLQCGEGKTYTSPPERMPDTQFGTGWKYLLVGKVNLKTGEIEEIPDGR